MKSRFHRPALLAASVLTSATVMLGVSPCAAQWTTQTISLRPGWNAVFLQVQPEPRECDLVLAGLQVESVWLWNRRFQPVQFVDDPGVLVPENPDWLAYFPSWHALSAKSSLFALLGGRCYLIKLSASAPSPMVWTVVGKPVVRGPEWVADSFNFVAFSISPFSPPTFQNFFAPSPAHTENPVFVLNPSGTWQRIISPASTTMQAGQAFWVRTTGRSDFAGPIRISLSLPGRLEYGETVLEQTLRMVNASTSTRTVTVTPLPSSSPSEGGGSAVAGFVPLSYWDDDIESGHFGWVQLNGSKSFPNLAPGQQVTLRLAVRRKDMSSPPLGAGADALYQSLLQVRDDSGGCYQMIPVSAKGLRAPVIAAAAVPGSRAQPVSSPSQPYKGLWVGSAIITNVSYAGHPSDTSQLFPTASQLQFRLIIHVNEAGEARLLQHVTLMWQTNNAQYVLVSNDELLGNYVAGSMRNGVPVGRRFSSVVFGFDKPELMQIIPPTGFGEGGTTVECTVAMDYEDSLNPFKHRFHPDHNNLTEDYRSALPEGNESYSFTRDLKLIFWETTAQSVGDPSGWGDREIGGDYSETLTGVHRKTLYIGGYFQLHRATDVATLIDGRLQ